MSLGLNVGVFQPSESIVRSVFDETPWHFEARARFPVEHGFSWVVSPSYFFLESQVADLESRIDFYALNAGFVSTLGQSSTYQPFVGAGLGYLSLVGKQENEVTGNHFKDRTRNSYGTYWEIGLELPSGLDENTRVQIKLLDQYIDYNLFGNINIGGKVLSAGVHYTVP